MTAEAVWFAPKPERNAYESSYSLRVCVEYARPPDVATGVQSRPVLRQRPLSEIGFSLAAKLVVYVLVPVPQVVAALPPPARLTVGGGHGLAARLRLGSATPTTPT